MRRGHPALPACWSQPHAGWTLQGRAESQGQGRERRPQVNFPSKPWQLPSLLLCEFCSWVTVAMKGCCAMWLGDCCISGCWCGLWSCCGNCTGCSAARLPATLLMTGTLCACEVFRPARERERESGPGGVSGERRLPARCRRGAGVTHSARWP